MRGLGSILVGGNIFSGFFLFSRSKASDIGIIAILVYFEKTLLVADDDARCVLGLNI